MALVLNEEQVMLKESAAGFLAENATVTHLRALRDSAIPTRPKVVFCTTENGMAHIRAAIEAGADEYVMKPFDRETLESKLQIVGMA